ncbi:MAG: glycosyltransferase, partial [Verrucomicrobiia bacterium]
MKVLVFAHTPPPHHGQARMVELMLEALGDRTAHRTDQSSEIRCLHVNCRFSDSIDQVSRIQVGKIFRLFWYILQALAIRVSQGPIVLYYIPAPAKRGAILRDWAILACLRPWFRTIVFHWHAAGLGYWATGTPEFPLGPDQPPLIPPRLFGLVEPLARALTRFLMGGAARSIVLTDYQRNEAKLLKPRDTTVVPNGIPDPCPDFQETVLPQRLARLAARRAALAGSSSIPSNVLVFRCLFLALCTREKGLFTSMDAVARANASLQDQSLPIRFHLTVAGALVSHSEQEEFEHRLRQPDLELPSGPGVNSLQSARAVTYVGFISGAEKDRLLRESDCLLFPTAFPNEVQPVSIIEALAYGLPTLVTAWRG